MSEGECARCGPTEFVPYEARTSEQVGDVEVTYTDRGMRCVQCNEVRPNATDIAAMNVERAAECARLGVPNGATFRRVRKALGYTKLELGSLLHETAETLWHWEKGQSEVPRTARALVVLLWFDAQQRSSATSDVLRALRAGLPIGSSGLTGWG